MDLASLHGRQGPQLLPRLGLDFSGGLDLACTPLQMSLRATSYPVTVVGWHWVPRNEVALWLFHGSVFIKPLWKEHLIKPSTIWWALHWISPMIAYYAEGVNPTAFAVYNNCGLFLGKRCQPGLLFTLKLLTSSGVNLCLPYSLLPDPPYF